MLISKQDIVTALEVKLNTELFFSATAEDACRTLIKCIRRASTKEEFTRAEADFLVNHALSEIFLHGGREERVRLCKILQHPCWTDISSEEIDLTGGLEPVF